jgi:predicted ATPase
MFTSLRLERFKSFKDAELKLGPFTVLIGANASGKSNIRDAFRFLHGIARGYSLAEIIGEKYGEGGERVWTGIRGGTREISYAGARSFALTVQTSQPAGEPLRYRIEVDVDKKHPAPRISREHLARTTAHDLFVGKAKDTDSLRVAIYSDNGCEDKVVGRVIQSRSHPFLARFAREVRRNGQLDLQATSRDTGEAARPLPGLEVFSSMRFFDWSPDAMRQPSLPGQDVLDDNGRNLSSVLYDMCQDPQGKRILISWVEELMPAGVADFEFPADPTGKVLATLVEKNGRRITLASASDGTLRLLAYVAAFLGPHPASFLFFEEVETSIHPTRLWLLLDLIENQVKHKGIQVVASTNSPDLLGRSSEKSLEHASLIYRLENEPDARIIRILDMPHAKRLMKKQRLCDLFATGWFESTALYMQPDPDDELFLPRPVRPRKAEAQK